MNNFNTQSQAVRQVARSLFDTDPKPDWATFFKQIMGVSGEIHKEFPDPAEAEKFYQTEDYRAIQVMLGQLRTPELDAIAQKIEPKQVITPRIPKSLHEALKAEVAELRVKGYLKMSLNQLVIVKCLVPTRPELLPPVVD